MTTPSLRRPLSSPKASSIWILLVVLLLPALVSHPSVFAAQKDKDKPYALIAGTVWGPDNRPVYGVRVKIRRSSDKPKKVRWEVFSDHHGEFAQRVPAGKEDYVISADLKGVKTTDGKQLQAEDVKVHIENDERADVGLHLKKVE